MTTKTGIPVADFVEKGADSDLLWEMISTWPSGSWSARHRTPVRSGLPESGGGNPEKEQVLVSNVQTLVR